MNNHRAYNVVERACLAILLFAIGLQQANAQFEVVFANPVYAQQPAGHVQDSTGGDIEDATIDLLDVRSNQLIATTTSDSKGNFSKILGSLPIS